MIAPATRHLPCINGVLLCTKWGKPRRRFSREEYLAALGCAEDEFKYFVRLFAPYRAKHIIRRTRDGEVGRWQTSRHVLHESDILRHVVGARLPGREPMWVGGFAWNKTRWAAIDVDRGDDQLDFEERCRHVERQLLVLGIPKSSLLILPSPRGGRHYYFFFRDRVMSGELPWVFAKVGIDHKPGRFEIYPRFRQGFRLPFGHVPGRPHHPDEWISFVRSHRDGTFPRVNWARCKKRAAGYVEKRAQRGLDQHQHRGDRRYFSAGVTVADDAETASPSAPGLTAATDFGVAKTARPYLKIISSSSVSESDVRELLRSGIRASGTRVQATKLVAWHLVFTRRMNEEDAVRQCVDWVYRAGQHTSIDVQDDIAQGTRIVELQTAEIVRWCLQRRNERGHKPGRCVRKKRFEPAELDVILARLGSVPVRRRRSYARFVLEFSNFAKTHGMTTAGGWICSPSVRGIIRRWPGCSGMHYKSKMDWAKSVGLLEMIREKHQTNNGSGRARTYCIHLPVGRREDWSLDLDEAVDYITSEPNRVDARRRLDKCDTYEVCPLGGSVNTHPETTSDRNKESVSGGG